MQSFVNGMNSIVYTDNGAVSNANFSVINSKKNDFVQFFFQTIRGMNKSKFTENLKNCFEHDPVMTMVLLFHLRDARGGKGERELFRTGFKLLQFDVNANLRDQLLHLVPEYGRFDDLVVLAPTSFYPELWKMLQKDQRNMNDGKSVSLLSKWMPTENSKLDKELGFVKKFCSANSISIRAYRKTLTSLREYLNIVERLISSNQWDDVEYSKVPSCAMQNLKKAFQRHSPEQFKEYIAKLETGKATINVNQLFPYQLVHDCRDRSADKSLLNSQWKTMVSNFEKQTSNWTQFYIPVADVSGSMASLVNGTKVSCMDVCMSLALLLAGVNTSPFKNKILTFSESPTWHDMHPETTIENQVNSLKRAPWGGSTNLQALFKLVLDVAVRNNLSQEQIPGLVIFSDMQFDIVCGYGKNSLTNLESARKMFQNEGYKLPNLIFWNLSAKTVDFPATDQDANIGLVSGFSGSLFKLFMETGKLDSMSLVQNVIDSERYKPVREVFNPPN